MQIGCTDAPYLCFVNVPKGLRLVNPKFNLCVMQERVFGEFKIRLYYDDCETSYPQHRYYVECIDTRHWVKMLIDSNVIDKTAFISMEDAVEKVKSYFRVRLNNLDYWDNFARP